jgi:predicted peroxiredoxin
MRNFVLFASLMLVLACQPTGEEAATPPRDGVVIHLSHGPDNPHRALMALQMAVKMAADKDVLLYFDINAVTIAVRDQANITYKQFPDANTQVNKLREAGVKMMVCPGCLQAAGFSREDLLDGFVPGEREAFFSFTEGRILTLDY